MKASNTPYVFVFGVTLLLTICTVVRSDGAGVQTPAVQTVAGSGQLGIGDGPANEATFLYPFGLAKDGSGGLFISDPAAQRIRYLSPAGIVKTVAGSGSIGKMVGFSVIGGYKDGPAQEAQFNHPMGIAVGPDGSLFIADSRNNCIRKLHGNVVTTVLGKAGDAAIADGNSDRARLVSPRALAFDSQGNMWIADYGGGLREFDLAGNLTTIPLSNPLEKNVVSLAYLNDKAYSSIVVSTLDQVYEYHIAEKRNDVIAATNHEGSGRFGTPGSLTALGPRQIIFSDPAAHNLRYLRLPVAGFATVPYTTIIAGGSQERGIDNAGYAAGGKNSDSRFYGPQNVTIAGNWLYVADSGNRRIRRLRLPAFRTPESLEVPGEYDREHFEIVLAGPSVTFWDSHTNEDSICGLIEKRLKSSNMLKKPPRCHPIRIDAASITKIEDYLNNVVVDRSDLDLVIMMFGSGSAQSFPVNSTIDVAVPKFRDSIVDLTDKLKTSRAPLLMVWEEDNIQISNAEDAEGRLVQSTFPDESYSAEEISRRLLFPALKGIQNFYQYNSFDDFVRYEHEGTLPLYGSPDTHTNSRGNAFLGRRIGDFIINNILKVKNSNVKS